MLHTYIHSYIHTYTYILLSHKLKESFSRKFHKLCHKHCILTRFSKPLLFCQNVSKIVLANLSVTTVLGKLTFCNQIPNNFPTFLIKQFVRQPKRTTVFSQFFGVFFWAHTSGILLTMVPVRRMLVFKNKNKIWLSAIKFQNGSNLLFFMLPCW